MEEIEKSLKSWHIDLNKSENVIENHNAIIKLLINDLRLQILMAEVDSKDKNNIALYGVQQSTNKNIPNDKAVKSPLMIEKSCASWNQYPIITTKAFKLACLLYKQSHIFHKGVPYTVDEFLKFRLGHFQDEILDQKLSSIKVTINKKRKNETKIFSFSPTNKVKHV